MDIKVMILIFVLVAFVAACGWLLGALHKERLLRRDAESGEEFWINVSKEQHGLLKEAVKETQSMICQGTESVTKTVAEGNTALLGKIVDAVDEYRLGVKKILKNLDALSAGGMDAEARRTLEADLGKLLSYSMEDAFKAAKGIGSDAE